MSLRRIFKQAIAATGIACALSSISYAQDLSARDEATRDLTPNLVARAGASPVAVVRQFQMLRLNKLMGLISNHLSGTIDVDTGKLTVGDTLDRETLAKVTVLAQRLHDEADMVLENYETPVGAASYLRGRQTESLAHANIWVRKERFDLIAQRLVDASADLVEASTLGDLAVIRERFHAVARACGHCHSQFRYQPPKGKRRVRAYERVPSKLDDRTSIKPRE